MRVVMLMSNPSGECHPVNIDFPQIQIVGDEVQEFGVHQLSQPLIVTQVEVKLVPDEDDEEEDE